jgi:hypothetical protein
MRAFAICGCLALLTACAKPEQQAAQDSAAGATLTLEALAGKWTVEARSAATDSLLVTYQVVATADPAGWSFSFPNRDPIPFHGVAVDGDSIMLDAGPYESALRKGAQVSTHSVLRLVNGELVGTTVARYSTSSPDSVLTGRLRAIRAQ